LGIDGKGTIVRKREATSRLLNGRSERKSARLAGVVDG
jgi:hypothetical protein